MFGREDKVPQIRITVIQYGILAVFLLLVFGLWRLQVMRSSYYQTLAQQNRIKEVPILAPRGKILDREGRIIVDNYPSFSALLLRNQGPISDATLDKIAAGLNLDPQELKAEVRRAASAPGYQPIYIKYDITPNDLAFIESHKTEFPELDTITVHRRLYPKDGFMANLIGYVGEISENMLTQRPLYNPGDIVGQSGVEAEYNALLMGQNGSRRVLVNSRGKEVGELSDQPAIPGRTLKLTVDIDLQIAAEQALGDKEGAIIAMNPHNGEVLALVSRPTFDPNMFAGRISARDWNAIVNDPGKPLLDKAIQAQLPPGSVFKIIMAVAGWQEGIAQNLVVHCTGGADFYGRYFKCWKKGGHGTVTLPKAIQQSCDVYFYTLAEKLGIDRIAKYAEEFGLGRKTGIDLPHEVSGVMPSEAWKIRNFHQRWFPGETISVGIGQGAVATTPVQLVRAIGAIAMDGKLVRPHVAFPDELPPQFHPAAYDQVQDIPIDTQGWDVITNAMATVTEPGGTAGLSHLPGIDFAGKTGSAQVVSNAFKARIANKSEYKDNGWFIGMTPRRDPDIIVCVLYQGGEHGDRAAHLAAAVIKAYVDKQRARGNLTAGTLPPNLQTPDDSGPVSRSTPPFLPGRAPHVVMTGLWSSSSEKDFHVASFEVPVSRHFREARTAPGMGAFAYDNRPNFRPRSFPAHRLPLHPSHATHRYVPQVFALLPDPVRSSEP